MYILKQKKTLLISTLYQSEGIMEYSGNKIFEIYVNSDQ